MSMYQIDKVVTELLNKNAEPIGEKSFYNLRKKHLFECMAKQIKI